MSFYQKLKNTIAVLLPKKVLLKHEQKFRNLLYLAYRGKNNECAVCNKQLSHFIKTKTNDYLCPNCGSLQRNRRLWLMLQSEFLQPNSAVLDFSPSRCLYRKMIEIETINYQSTDLSGDFIAQHQYDITKIDCKDASFDLIICYHILEHIDQDIVAMNELYRVLKTSGKILIQTPFKEGEIYENITITSENDRLIHFGQEDHVRIYSVNGLKNRLEQIGFSVEVRTNFKNDLYLGLDENETILIASKP